MYAAFQGDSGLARKDNLNLQKVLNLFSKCAEINRNTMAPHSGSRPAAYGFPLAPGFPEGHTAARDSLHLGEVLQALEI